MPVTRREFLIAASAGGLALAGCSDAAERLVDPNLAVTPDLPLDLSKVEHVIVTMMENRSFDHYMGWLPQADAKNAGLSYPDRDGVFQKTYPLAPDFQGCGFNDPDHSFAGGRVELNNGACDGWLLAGNNDRFAIGYYRREDLPFLGQAATTWTTFDRYFCSVLGPTYPNRMYQHCAQTDRLTNSLVISELPTIWDRLAEAGVSARYYYSDVPFLGLWGAKYLSIGRSFAQFESDCAAGTLPAVSFVEPGFFFSPFGNSNDDHPFADIRAGQTFMNRVYQSVAQSPNWSSTVLVINYDEWGGFFDHVPPPTGSTEPAEQQLGYTDGLLGFRVPVVLISPFAPRRTVSHQVFEHCSILKLIEQRWNLTPLTQRDANANSLASVLVDGKDVTKAPPAYAVPTVEGSACPVAAAGSSIRAAPEEAPWGQLQQLARQYGWPV
jgi:phospholipase C